MKPKSPFSAPYQNTAGDPDRLGHRRGPFVATCDVILGYPDCLAAAVRPGECTELLDIETLKPVTDEQHKECERRGLEAFVERAGSPCDDCAFRPGSPEMRDELTLGIAEQTFNGHPVPFRCHQGMPLRFCGNEEDGTPKVSYEPRDPLGSTYPVCNGWAFVQALGKAEVIDAILGGGE